MIAVDTSVWIDYFRYPDSEVRPDLERLLDDEEVILPAPVWIELLTGAKTQEQDLLRKVLSALPRPIPTKSTWKTMESWTALSVKKGRRFGMGDLLVAAISVENSAKVWSLDQDFSQMAKLKFVKTY